MPRIEEFTLKNKKFHKKRLRPWNILEIEENADVADNQKDSTLNGELDNALSNNLDKKKDGALDSELEVSIDNVLGGEKINDIESELDRVLSKEKDTTFSKELNNELANKLSEKLANKWNNVLDTDIDNELNMSLESELNNELDMPLVGKLDGELDNKKTNLLDNDRHSVLNESKTLKNETSSEMYNNLYNSLYNKLRSEGNLEKKTAVLDDDDLYNSKKVLFELTHLSGEQLEILKRIVSLCDNSGKTCLLNRSNFNDCSKSINTFKINIVRLINKGLLVRGISRRGVSGFFSFEVPDMVLDFFDRK